MKPFFLWLKRFFILLFILLIVKSFILDWVVIPDAKMEKTLKSGQLVWIFKLPYGARFPITLLTVPFFPDFYLEFIQFPVFRLPGFIEPKPNDIIAFNYPGQHDPPIDKREIMVKRIIGKPGDTLLISDKKLFVNGILFKEPGTLQFNYRVSANNKKFPPNFFEKYSIKQSEKLSEEGLYELTLTQEQANQFALDSMVRSIRIIKDFPGENVKYMFPVGYYYHFNKDYFGPLVVPYQGLHVYLDTHSVELYADIIEFYEKNELEVKNYKIYINGNETSQYTIKNDYYFVMDDNRDRAKDSRHWGFLPKNFILGKIVGVATAPEMN